MKFTFLNTVLTCVICFSTVPANAGIILDTANDSFIDTATGLEWMDFGINNNQSFNYVTDNLDAGEEYYGWALATKAQVYTMWANAFLGLGAVYEDPNAFGAGQLWVYDGASIYGSVLAPIADAMGYNYIAAFGASDERLIGRGHFQGTNGLSYVQIKRHTDRIAIDYHNDVAQISDNSNLDGLKGIPSIQHSTMLVRIRDENFLNPIPEPSILTIFALSVVGLASYRFKKS